ncbi:MAG: hypothetical protein ACJA0X_001805 [Cyclobacteriaceae bacterium]|jgi:hypothetical protein
MSPEQLVNMALDFNHIFTFGENQGMLDTDTYYSHLSNKIIPDYVIRILSNMPVLAVMPFQKALE